MHTNYWTYDSVIERQKNEPVYHTNATCDSTMDPETGRKVFSTLDLEWNGAEDYPVLPSEMIHGEDDSLVAGCNVLAGYTLLYRGRKYFGPTAEFGYRTPRDLPGDNLPAEAEAKHEAEAWTDRVRSSVDALGGFIWNDDTGDRLCVVLMLPMERVLAKAKTFDEYKSLLAAL